MPSANSDRVGVIQHHYGVVAAQLEGGALEVTRSRGGDGLAGGNRAGEADLAGQR
jgi:hypothetical protein